MKASIWRGFEVKSERPGEVPPPGATGYAQETMTQRGVNATSALENCETSAIGRALANLGYSPKGKRPSREEMAKASKRGGRGSTTRTYGEGASDREPDPPQPTPEGGGDGAPEPTAAPSGPPFLQRREDPDGSLAEAAAAVVAREASKPSSPPRRQT